MPATALALQWLDTWTRDPDGASDLEPVPSASWVAQKVAEVLQARVSADTDPRGPAVAAAAAGTVVVALAAVSSSIWFWYQPRLSSSVSRMS